MATFIEVVDCIFINKEKYWSLTDDDKINAFFIINRKFAYKYPKVSNLINSKFTDKASAIDQWFLYFRNTKGIPGWYWQTKSKKKEQAKEKNYDDVVERFEFKPVEMDFLKKYFKKELDTTLKEILEFKKED
jgi:hypothetical protein